MSDVRPLRILHVAKLDPRAPGGIERFVHDLIEAQVARGDAVSVVACSAPVPGGAAPPVHRLKLARTRLTLFHLPIAPSFPRAVRAEIDDFAPDVVHLHWPNPLAIGLARDLPLRSPRGAIPLVIHWHADIDPAGATLPIRIAYAALVRAAERRLLARADAVIATSAAYAAASAPLRAVPSERLHVVPLALATSNVAARAVAWPYATPRRVLFIGRLVPYKALDVLIEAIARVPDASLVVIGDGPERGAWVAAAARSQAAARIAFAGAVSEAEKRGWLAAASVLCLPSRNRLEAFGMVLLEAAEAGVPVIAADIAGSGTGWVARELVGGATFPVGDAAGLAAVLGGAEPVPPASRTALPTIGAVAESVDSVYRSSEIGSRSDASRG